MKKQPSQASKKPQTSEEKANEAWKQSQKKLFCERYVLNRALTSDNLSGEGAAEQALNAWDRIHNVP